MAAVVPWLNKEQLLYDLTGPSAASRALWVYVNGHRDLYTAYNFTWNTDYCSAHILWKIKDNPAGADWKPACLRHDFGYHNYKAIGGFTDETKRRIDDTFYWDMVDACITEVPVTSQPICESMAATYYYFVRVFGT